MKICLITTFPPSRGGLTEYGFHIARELRQNPFLSVTVLADQLSAPSPELADFNVSRCWRFNDPTSAGRLLHAIHKLQPDVVWFNLLFSTFGRSPLPAFLGLTTPLLSRLGGFYTHVTLHHLVDNVDMTDAGIRFQSLYRAAGSVATRMLLLANSVSVLLPAYRSILQERHGGQNVHVRPHGILAHRPEYPDFSRRNNPESRILVFGKWGTYKRLEPILDAFPLIREKCPAARLVIAGSDHPHTPGYVQSIADRYRDDPSIEFTGYVPEDAIADLFRTASLTVLPYSSSTGASGVVHQACAYGVPIVSVDLPDFRRMAEDEDLAVEFCRRGDRQDLADRILRLLQSLDEQRAMAEQNFYAALRMTMPQIISGYLRHFDLDQYTRRLRHAGRLRRLRHGSASRSLLGWALARGPLAWGYRPALLHARWNGHNGHALPEEEVAPHIAPHPLSLEDTPRSSRATGED